MSSDIVERLRRISGGSSVVDLARDAADEIERLHAEVDRLRAEVDRLRAAGDALAEVSLGARPWITPDEQTLCDAVAEIVRLRAEVERLRAAGDALAANYELMLEQDWSSFLEAFLHAWKEARRG